MFDGCGSIDVFEVIRCLTLHRPRSSMSSRSSAPNNRALVSGGRVNAVLELEGMVGDDKAGFHMGDGIALKKSEMVANLSDEKVNDIIQRFAEPGNAFEGMFGPGPEESSVDLRAAAVEWEANKNRMKDATPTPPAGVRMRDRGRRRAGASVIASCGYFAGSPSCCMAASINMPLHAQAPKAKRARRTDMPEQPADENTGSDKSGSDDDNDNMDEGGPDAGGDVPVAIPDGTTAYLDAIALMCTDGYTAMQRVLTDKVQLALDGLNETPVSYTALKVIYVVRSGACSIGSVLFLLCCVRCVVLCRASRAQGCYVGATPSAYGGLTPHAVEPEPKLVESSLRPLSLVLRSWSEAPCLGPGRKTCAPRSRASSLRSGSSRVSRVPRCFSRSPTAPRVASPRSRKTSRTQTSSSR